MLTIQQMMIFAAVCQEGTLQRAADKLYLSQSAVSKALKEIGTQSGLKLFSLIGRRLQPTDAALSLLEDVNRVLVPYNMLQQKLTSNSGEHYTPCLHIGCGLSIEETVIPGVVARFSREYPGVRLRLVADYASSIEKFLLAGEFDFAVTTGNATAAGIIQDPFGKEIFVWVCSPKHPLAAEKSVDFRRLSQETIYLPDTKVFDRTGLEARFLRAGVRLAPTYLTTTPRSPLNMVLSSDCVALISYNFVSEYLRSGGEVHLIDTVPGLRASRAIGAWHLQGRKLGAEARSFIEFCRAAVQERFPLPPWSSMAEK